MLIGYPKRPAVNLAPVGVWLAVSVIATGQFVFQTSLVGSGAGAVASVCALASFAGLLVAGGSVRLGSLRSIRPAQASAAALAGLLSFAGSPLLALSNRFSDAPAGSLALFWTAPFAGLALIAVGAFARRESNPWSISAAALLGLVGAAGVLADWERPSSFSLLTRHVPQQLALGASALTWAAGIVVLAMLARRRGIRPVFGWAALGTLAGGVVLGAVSAAEWPQALSSPMLGMLAICVTGVTAFVSRDTSKRGTGLSGTALLAVPALLTLFTFIEAAVGALGPRPVLLGPVAAASALIAAGCAGVLAAQGEGVRAGLVARVFAAVAAAAALVAMAMPGLSVAVQGLRSDMQGFRADFAFRGVETMGGWIVLALALFLLTKTMSRQGVNLSGAVVTALVALVAAAAWMVLRFVPLHTWVTWIPPEVQQDYGTEYASITFTAVTAWAQIASLAAGAAAAFALAAGTARGEAATMEGSAE